MFLSLYVADHSACYHGKLEATAVEAQRQLQAAKDEADVTHTHTVADLVYVLMDNTTSTSFVCKKITNMTCQSGLSSFNDPWSDGFENPVKGSSFSTSSAQW